MTTTAPTPTATDLRRLNWFAPDRAGLAARSRASSVGFMLVAILATGTDIALMHPAISRAMPDVHPLQAWGIAIGLGLVALVCATLAGNLWRGAQGNHPGSWGALVPPAALGLLWLGLGIWIVRLRVAAETSTAGEVAYQDLTGTASAHTGTGSHAAIAAGTFLFVYLLAGALAAVDAHASRNDAWSAGREELVAAESVRARLAEHEGAYVRLLTEVVKRREEIARIDAAAATARRSHAAFAGELKQLVREQLALAWGDPRRSGIASADHPSNPHRPGTSPGEPQEA